MRSVRVRLLVGVLFAVVLLFAAANAHGDHGMDNLEKEDVAASSASESPSPAVESPIFNELPTFTVWPS
jgi:hypothetical protein